VTDHSSDVPGIAIVRSSRGWARLLHRYVVDHGGAIVRARPLEERQAIEEDYDILLVDDISSFLSTRIVKELHERGRRVLGVYDPEEFAANEEHTGKQRLLRLGVDAVIEAQATPEAFVRAIEDLAPARRSPFADTSSTSFDEDPHIIDLTAHDQSDDVVVVSKDVAILPQRLPATRRRGHVTVVLGASGGAGATEVAVQLARDLGRRGERSVILDSDEIAPSVAQRLNLSLHPNIRTAVDVVEHGTGRLAECLVTVATHLEVLVGLPHPKDWVELRGSDLDAVVNELARGRPQVVVNASHLIEDLTPYGSADRFGMSRASVAAADTVVLVCAPTPTGIARLLDRVTDLAPAIEGRPLHIVVNRVHKGGFKKNEIAREIQRHITPTGLHFLPADLRVERAGWDGTLVPSGEFTKALAATLLPMIPRATVGASSKNRRRPPRPRANHFRSSKGA
jgi:MinD-like ATPase involved in chromosome partitioning or flagellar assembly